MKEDGTDWELFVGKLITSFGGIELVTHKLFQIWLPKNNSHNHVLSKRLDTLISHIESLTDKNEKKDRIRDLLKRAKILNIIRNQVAHNPVILKKFDDIGYDDVIADLRGKDEPLTVESLQEYAANAESVKSEMFIVVSQYTNRGIDEIIT